MGNRRFENAFQFLASYFHEDFGQEFASPKSANRAFIAGSDPSTQARVTHELRDLFGPYQGEQLDTVVFQELGCYYRPGKHRGISTRAWLEEVIGEVENSVS